MISLSVTVELVDGDVSKYPVTPRVQVDFERQFKVAMIEAFADAPKMEHLYWLGWKASHAGGAVVKPFDGWLDTVVSVRPEDGGPLGQTSPELSPPSP